MIYGIIASSRARTTTPTSTYDVDFQSWIDYNILQGHYLPATLELDKANAHIEQMKVRGIWSKKDTYHIFAWNDINCDDCSLVCIKRRVKATVYGGMTYTSDGWLGDGTTGYIELNFIPSTDGVNYTATNASRTYLPFGSWGSFRRVCGHHTNKIDRVYIANTKDSQSINWDGSHTNNFESRYDGLKSISRNSNTEVGFTDKDIFSLNTTTGTTAELANDTYLLFKADTTISYGNGGLSQFSLGSKLTQTQVQDFRTDLNTYLVAIGLTAKA